MACLVGLSKEPQLLVFVVCRENALTDAFLNCLKSWLRHDIVFILTRSIDFLTNYYDYLTLATLEGH